jgi:hypothetical protein
MGCNTFLADMQASTGIGEHGQTIKLLPGRFFVDPESLVFIPVTLRFLFNGLRAIGCFDHGVFPGSSMKY